MKHVGYVMIAVGFLSGALASVQTSANDIPVPPSMVKESSLVKVRPPIVTVLSPTSTATAPTTAGMPHPRATTAAWLARPPVAVRIPAAFAIP